MFLYLFLRSNYKKRRIQMIDDTIPRFLVKLRCFIVEDAIGHKEGVS